MTSITAGNLLKSKSCVRILCGLTLSGIAALILFYQNVRLSLITEQIDGDTSPPPLSNEVTIVTSFLNLGSFEKGSRTNMFTPKLYRSWMKSFAQLQNPLVVYLDDDEDVEIFRSLRSHPSLACRTRIVKVRRNDTWAFSLYERIHELYSNVSYPKHYPNTVYASYPCAMHAKYEFVMDACRNNFFRTKYFAWLDIGYFREMINERNTTQFSIGTPPGFKEEGVAYTAIGDQRDLKPERIFKDNVVWIGGGFFIANVDVMVPWIKVYKESVEYFLDQNLMDTDQQIIYSLMNLQRSVIPLQSYKLPPGVRGNMWFYLGYLCQRKPSEEIRDPASDKCDITINSSFSSPFSQ